MYRLILLLAFALGACVSTTASMLDTRAHYTATCSDAVVIYTTRDKAPPDYAEVALLSSSGESRYTNHQMMIESMRKEAAKVGATGVILNDIKEAGSGEKIVGAILGTGTERQGKAVAIYAAADTARVRDACAAARMAGLSTVRADSALPTTEAMCPTADTFERNRQGTVFVEVHQWKDGKCVTVLNCGYDNAFSMSKEDAIERCRNELKKPDE